MLESLFSSFETNRTSTPSKPILKKPTLGWETPVFDMNYKRITYQESKSQFRARNKFESAKQTLTKHHGFTGYGSMLNERKPLIGMCAYIEHGIINNAKESVFIVNQRANNNQIEYEVIVLGMNNRFGKDPGRLYKVIVFEVKDPHNCNSFEKQRVIQFRESRYRLANALRT